MRRIVLTITLITLVVSAAGCGFENRKGYYYDNHWYNFVREAKLNQEVTGTINQPYEFSEPQMSTILRMVEIKKGSAFTKDEKFKEVFDTYSINKLTPALVEAFKNVTPAQQVEFGFLVKDPTFIIKNDRFTSGIMWVEDNKLRIKFDKLCVKVTGDTNKRGYYNIERSIQQARGLRVTLETQPGMEYGSSTTELVVDPGIAMTIAEERLKKEAELAAMGLKTDVKIEVIKDKSAQARLKELETLKKERMITEEEYQVKKQEILNQL